MQLWFCWWDVIALLRPAFSRWRTFVWFTVCVAGLSVRTDKLGVTSIVRALGLDGEYYDNLIDSLHSTGVKLDALSATWAKTVLGVFPGLVRVNGRLVLVGDGIKVGKQGRKMPGVKCLHQESDSNTKAEYIMGHSFQAVSILAQAAQSIFAVPLAARIHEGVVETNRDKRTLMDKMIALLAIVGIEEPYYLVADRYYQCRKMVRGLLAQGNHLVVRVKSNAVAWTRYIHKGGHTGPGRPRIYGEKVKLRSLFRENRVTEEALSPVYGEKGVTIRYAVHDLLWRPVGLIVRFVIVIHPSRGRFILMSTDTSLGAVEIIRLYGLRFKIEFAFKQAVHVFGAFYYHFWMKLMKPLKRRNGNQYLHRESAAYRKAVKRKLHAYHVFVQAGIVAQGLAQYLAACHPEQVWRSFGSWLRTIRPGLAPSERVVTTALRQSLPEFLLDRTQNPILAKFIVERQDPDRSEVFRPAA
ncbi:MAG: transposase [Alphaproteobacteria bacterium]|nr:transposase [Alphaproteobacteria bacterium]